MKNYNFGCVGLALAITLFAACVATSSLPVDILNPVSDHRNVSDVPNPRVVFLGTVDGKNYFHDDIRDVDWITAIEICGESGLKLATITTVAQLNFLNNAQASGNLIRYEYWLGAREARLPRMYSWDLTGNEVSTVIADISDQIGDNYFACLTYVGSDSAHKIHAHPCSTRGDLGILCET